MQYTWKRRRCLSWAKKNMCVEETLTMSGKEGLKWGFCVLSRRRRDERLLLCVCVNFESELNDMMSRVSRMHFPFLFIMYDSLQANLAPSERHSLLGFSNVFLFFESLNRRCVEIGRKASMWFKNDFLFLFFFFLPHSIGLRFNFSRCVSVYSI